MAHAAPPPLRSSRVTTHTAATPLKVNMYTNAHAAALLTAFTHDQQMAIIDLCKTSSDPIRTIGTASARAPGLVPIFSLIDMGVAIDPDDIANWMTGLSIVTTRSLLQPWDVATIANILDRGGAIPSDYAARLAAEIITPDTEMAGLAYRLTQSIAALPFVPDAVQDLAQPFMQAMNYLSTWMSSRDTGRDNNVMILRLGQVTNRLSKEMLFTFAEANFERKLIPPDAGGVMGAATSIFNWLTGQDANLMPPGGIPPVAPAGMPEGGDPGDPASAETVFRMMQDAARTAGTAYETGDIASLAEMGFLPPGLTKAAARIGKAGVQQVLSKVRSRRRRAHAASSKGHPALPAPSEDLNRFAATMRRAGLDPSSARDVSTATELIAYASAEGRQPERAQRGLAPLDLLDDDDDDDLDGDDDVVSRSGSLDDELF